MALADGDWTPPGPEARGSMTVPLSASALGSPILVIAPHPDDETLGLRRPDRRSLGPAVSASRRLRDRWRRVSSQFAAMGPRGARQPTREGGGGSASPPGADAAAWRPGVRRRPRRSPRASRSKASRASAPVGCSASQQPQACTVVTRSGRSLAPIPTHRAQQPRVNGEQRGKRASDVGRVLVEVHAVDELP